MSGLETLLLLMSSLVPAQEAAPASPAPASRAPEVAPPTEAPIARLTRLTDPVARLDGRARAEEMLFHWDKSADLRRGDGLRQGVHADSEIYFVDDRSVVRVLGEAELRVGRTASGARTLDVVEMRSFQVKVRERPLVIRLPGDTEVTATGTWFRVTLDPLDRRHVIRNAGPGEVTVKGPVTPVREGGVLPGHEVEIPLVVDPPSVLGVHDDAWAGARIEVPDGVRSEMNQSRLILSGSGVARVGGARLKIQPGRTLMIRRPQRKN